jgi:uncharacterized protein
VKLQNEFEVPASPEATWNLVTDVPRVIPCMPGAQLDEMVDENTFKVTMHVKLGPISLQFATDIQRQELDQSAKSTTLAAKARDVKGRGGATATIESTLEPAPEGTRVKIVTDLQMQGTLASTGRGIVGDVANQLTQRFAECLAAQLQQGAGAAGADGSGSGAGAAEARAPAEPSPVKPVGGLGLVLRAVFRPLLRLLGRG